MKVCRRRGCRNFARHNAYQHGTTRRGSPRTDDPGAPSPAAEGGGPGTGSVLQPRPSRGRPSRRPWYRCGSSLLIGDTPAEANIRAGVGTPRNPVDRLVAVVVRAADADLIVRAVNGPTRRELAAVLAGLRLLQHDRLVCGDRFIEIAEDAGPMLTDEEIDQLCERLNTGGGLYGPSFRAFYHPDCVPTQEKAP